MQSEKVLRRREHRGVVVLSRRPALESGVRVPLLRLLHNAAFLEHSAIGVRTQPSEKTRLEAAVFTAAEHLTEPF